MVEEFLLSTIRITEMGAGAAICSSGGADTDAADLGGVRLGLHKLAGILWGILPYDAP